MSIPAIIIKYVKEHGYDTNISFFKRQGSKTLYFITSPKDEDFGEPLVVVVDNANKSMTIRPASEFV